MLTKQLQALIDISLSSGRSFDDIRALLKIQGFEDPNIDTIFEAYRQKGQASGLKQQVVATYVAPPAVRDTVPTRTDDVVIETETPSLSEAVSVEVSPEFVPSAPAVSPAQDIPAAPKAFETPVGLYTPGAQTNTPTAPVFEAPIIMPTHTAPTTPVVPMAPATAHTTPDVVPSATPTPPASVVSGSAIDDDPFAAPPTDVAPAAVSSTTIPSAPTATAPDFSHAFESSPDTSAVSATQPTATTPASPTTTPSLAMPMRGSINVGLQGIPELEQAALDDYKRKQAASPVPLIITLIVVVVLIAGTAYWFFTLGPGKPIVPDESSILNQRRTPPSTIPATGATSTTTNTTAPATSTGPVDPFTGQPIME